MFSINIISVILKYILNIYLIAAREIFQILKTGSEYQRVGHHWFNILKHFAWFFYQFKVKIL